MMKAAIYDSFGGPITIQEVATPQLPNDGVIIQVMATGVCRSDWHGWKGHDGDIHTHGLPMCPGHEFSGVVVRTGPSTHHFQAGDRVAIPFILSCGSCGQCTKGRPTVCAKQEQPGFTRWGSFAEYVAVPRADRNLRHLPPEVTFVQAAALGCRFTTAYRAVLQQGQLQPRQSVAIFGCGGLGLSCILMAKHRQLASQIIAVDVSSSALKKARELGATHTVLLNHGDDGEEEPQAMAKLVAQCTDGHEGADLTIDAAGFAATSQAAVYATRPSGRMVQVGLPYGNPPIPMSLVAGREITIVGSHGFDAQDLPDLLELIATNDDEGKIMDPCQLVEREVTLEEGCRALQDMDHISPLGIVMITKFGKISTTTTPSRL